MSSRRKCDGAKAFCMSAWGQKLTSTRAGDWSALCQEQTPLANEDLLLKVPNYWNQALHFSPRARVRSNRPAGAFLIGGYLPAIASAGGLSRLAWGSPETSDL